MWHKLKLHRSDTLCNILTGEYHSMTLGSTRIAQVQEVRIIHTIWSVPIGTLSTIESSSRSIALISCDMRREARARLRGTSRLRMRRSSLPKRRSLRAIACPTKRPTRSDSPGLEDIFSSLLVDFRWVALPAWIITTRWELCRIV